MKNCLLFCFLGLNLFSLTSQELSSTNGGFLPLSTHTTPIIETLVSTENDWLISMSEDSQIRVWHRATRDLLASQKISDTTTLDFRLHPYLPQILVLTRSQEGEYFLSGYDFHQKSFLFSQELDSLPIYFDYSQGGNLYFISKVEAPTLVFHNATNGEFYSNLTNAFGISSYGYIGTSERTFMSYNAGGTILFYDILTGAQKLNVSSTPNLKDIAILEDPRYLIGFVPGEIQIVDRLEGTIESVVFLDDIESIYLSPDKKDLIVLTRDQRFTYYQIVGQRLRLRNIVNGNLPNQISDFSLDNGKIFLGLQSGELQFRYYNSNVFHNFAENFLNPILDIFLEEDTLVLLGEDSLGQMASGFFQSGALEDLEPAEYIGIPNDLAASKIIERSGDRFYLLTEESITRSQLVEYDISSGDVSVLMSVNEPIKKIVFRNDRFFFLTENGDFYHYTASNRSPEVWLYGLAALDFILLEDRVILSRPSLGNSSLVQIDINTRETVFLDDPKFISFKVMEDTMGGFYEFAVVDEQNPVTTITHHTGEVEKLIYQTPGEIFNFTAAVQEETGNLIMTHSGTEIGLHSRGQWSWITDYGVFPTKITLQNDMIFMIDHLGAISIYEDDLSTYKGRIAIFESDSWRIMNESAKVSFGNPGSENYVGNGTITRINP